MTPPETLRRLPGPVLLAVLLLFSLGCEEDVTAVLGTDRAFEMYGVLTPLADTQVVRIFPIADRLRLNRGEPLDATMTSVDRTSGETIVWSDTLAPQGDGTFAYGFWAPLRPEGGHTYRLTVERSDGAASHVDVTSLESPEIEPVTTDTVTARFSIHLGSVPVRIDNSAVTYLVQLSPSFTDTLSLRIPFGDRLRTVDGEQHVEIVLNDDYRELAFRLSTYGRLTTYGVRLLEARLDLRVRSIDWVPPGGVFDPEVLVEPGVFTNVENGFGFVGSGYNVARSLEVSEKAQVAAGFREP